MLDLRVTAVNLKHIFQLNVYSLHEILKLSGLCKELYREQIIFALELLRNNPACDSLHLQPHLEKELPNWSFISAPCMSNFCIYANTYLL